MVFMVEGERPLFLSRMAQPPPRCSRHRDLLWKEYFRDPPPHNHSSKMDEEYSPSWVLEESRRRVFVKSRHGKLKPKQNYMLVETAIDRDDFMFIDLLKDCAKRKNLYQGIRLHTDILERGLLEKSPYIASILISMYAKCEELERAHQVLEELPIRNVFSWSALIAGYVQQGQGHEALNCFEQMQNEGLSPDAVTFTCTLKACGITGDIDKGKQIHDEIVHMGFLHKDIMLGTALIDMYTKCGLLSKARQVIEGFPVRDAISWSALIAGYVQHGQCNEALNCFEQMQNEGFSPDAVIFICLLMACGSTRAVEKGMEIHKMVVGRGLLKKDIMLGTALLDMYVKCDALSKAQEVLEELPIRNVVSWNALIAGYAQQGHKDRALDCFERMKSEGFSPDSVTFTCVLKACGSAGAIDKGKQIHDEIVNRGLLGNDVVLGNALVDMYAKCGMLTKAKQILEELPFQNVVSWCTLIAGYAQQGQGREALNCFERMQSDGFLPDLVTLTCILKVCGSTGAIDKGKQIHDLILSKGLLEKDPMLGTALVDMYAKCGAPAKAQEVLEVLPGRHVVPWNALITGYAQQGQCHEALNCFRQMQNEGISPDAVTFICILKACGSIGNIDKGERIHEEIVSRGLLEKNVMVGNALVDMYAKCGVLSKALEVLEMLPIRDVVTWNALIAGYAQQGQGHEVMHCFERMQSEGLSPNAITYTCILKACGNTEAIDKGAQIHEVIVSQGLLENDHVLATALVDMYAKCGVLCKAQRLLEAIPDHNVAPWNALITGHIEQGQIHKALACFEEMQMKGLSPHAITFVCILKACGSIGAIAKGKQIHDFLLSSGMLDEDMVLGTSLVNMYAKFGMLTKAKELLELLPVQNVVSWSSLMSGFMLQGKANESLNCFERMQIEGLSPNAMTYSCTLGACGETGAINKGEHIHHEIVRRGMLEMDVVLATTLVNMYAKCGMLQTAQRVLEDLPIRNVVSWNVLIVGYAQQGQCHKALVCYEMMQREHIIPNEVTLLGILSACSHTGLLDEAQMLFSDMTGKYGIVPMIEHHTCMVFALGCAGHFEKAMFVIQMMQSFTCPAVWFALLASCQKWRNLELGKLAFGQVVQLEDNCAPAYVVMSNIFARAGLWKDVQNVESMRLKYAT